jgi:NitT/TauT family transport system substrate-binding protein
MHASLQQSRDPRLFSFPANVLALPVDLPARQEAIMGCCESTNPNLIGIAEEREGELLAELNVDRRTALKGLLGMAALTAAAGNASGGEAAATKLKLAFCGQLLCVIPYEVTRARGHFAEQGLDVQLVYTRGGNAAMQALVGGSVDYAGTSFDVALQAFSKGAKIRRFASTGRLPLFALAVAPKQTATIKTIKDLEGKTVAVSGLGNADHALMLYLLDHAGADPGKVRFAVMGTNLYDALRLGQVDAGMVQEPALTLIVQAGGRELMNAMDMNDAQKYLGGSYEFMGVTVRAEERDRRLEEMKRLATALKKGLQDTRTIPPDDIIAALPKSLISGGNVAQLKEIITRYRASLYPETVTIDMASAQRVQKAHIAADILKPDAVDMGTLLDTAVLGG